MKEEKKRARAADKLAELFGLQEHLPTELPSPTIISSNNKSREAEAVLAYMDSHKRFSQKPCKWCESTFASDRGNVAYCSDLCRQKALAELGILWDPNKDPRERWDFKMIINDSGDSQLTNENLSREPLTVPPPALVVADLALESQKQDMAQKLLQVSDVSSEPVVSESQSFPTVYNL